MHPGWALFHGLMRGFEPLIARFSPIGNTPFFPSEKFPWTTALQVQWPAIRAELDTVLGRWELLPSLHEVDPTARWITRNRHWKTFYLVAYGHRLPLSARQCPETLRALQQVPGLVTAMFSILSPGKRIPPHRGNCKGLLRCHLGLLVPQPRDDC